MYPSPYSVNVSIPGPMMAPPPQPMFVDMPHQHCPQQQGNCPMCHRGMMVQHSDGSKMFWLICCSLFLLPPFSWVGLCYLDKASEMRCFSCGYTLS